MHRQLLLLFIISSLLWSCGEKDKPANVTKKAKAKGGKFYGGVMRYNESEFIKSLYPLSITDIYSYRTSTQIYEGLLKFDQKDLSVINGIAESYEIDESKKVYTFKLKKGVYFHDADCFPNGKGREVTAEDVKYCFVRACTRDASNQGFSIFEGILKGADKYYTASEGGHKPSFDLDGVKVIDKYTLQLTLTRPDAVFKYNLARPFAFIYPKEAVEKYGKDMRFKPVGTGPFYMASMEDGNSIILKKFGKYHGKDELGNQLPFLDGIKISFLKDKKVELLEFQKNNLDMVYRINTDQIIQYSEKAHKDSKGNIIDFELQRNPEMGTQFLVFNNKGKIFSNKNIRKAFSFAIDREMILAFVLNGEGEGPGHHGIVPPTFEDYDTKKIRGYHMNKDSARFYLEKAGYPSGSGFPKISLDINAEGERQYNVAQAVQKQLKDNLNIDIKINMYPYAQLLENEFQGDFSLARSAYFADYPSAENFLWLFYGKDVPSTIPAKSYPNIARFQNKKYDRYYVQGIQAGTQKESNEYFMKAGQVLMDEAGIAILWYEEAYRLIKTYIKDMPNNAMQYRDFSKVYFDKNKKAEKDS